MLLTYVLNTAKAAYLSTSQTKSKKSNIVCSLNFFFLACFNKYNPNALSMNVFLRPTYHQFMNKHQTLKPASRKRFAHVTNEATISLSRTPMTTTSDKPTAVMMQNANLPAMLAGS